MTNEKMEQRLVLFYGISVKWNKDNIVTDIF